MPAPGDPQDEGARLKRCIRDLAALNALPSMCVGRSPDEAIELVLDALPTALSCALVFLRLPGSHGRDRASLFGALLDEEALLAMRACVSGAQPFDGRRDIPGIGHLWCHEVELPVGKGRGRFIAGRTTPMDPEVDRTLIRSAANLVGTVLESANVLEAARRKDDFLALLGHELRNPLAPILTAVELLAHHRPVARERQVIERNTRHLARLVDDLLDISRVTRGHIELRREHVMLATILDDAVEIVAQLCKRHHHTLRVAPAGDIAVRGDPVRLAQVFGNLLTNAAKFTPPGGAIDVLVDRHPGRVRVSVRDNGRGISRDALRRVFEPFVQVNRERDALQGGLGLGLAIVADLVQRHDGIVSVESEGPGLGSTFTVELPVVAPVVAREPLVVPRPPAVRAGVRVLVVDDNVDVAELLSEALQHEGFKTEVAYDGRAALERWPEFVPHAAVLDVGLPGLDGYELARTVRQRHGNTATLIAATGYGQRSDRREAAAAGFDCHFVKPVSVQDLVRVLDERVVGQSGSDD